jgi:hypothetical protein
MDYVRWLLTVLEHHKDAIVAVAALLAPFAAVFAAIRASGRQSRASLEAAKLQSETIQTTARLQIEAQTAIAQDQIRATVGIVYRQRLTDHVREILQQLVARLADITFNSPRVPTEGEGRSLLKFLTDQVISLQLLIHTESESLLDTFSEQYRDAVLYFLNFACEEPSTYPDDGLVERFKRAGNAAGDLLDAEASRSLGH